MLAVDALVGTQVEVQALLRHVRVVVRVAALVALFLPGRLPKLVLLALVLVLVLRPRLNAYA